MAGFTERISVIIDVTSNKATQGLKDFRSAVADAQGFTGKLKAGVGSLKDTFITAAASPAALATGAAAAGAALMKLVADTSELGIAIGDLSDKTGMTVEESSRWLEVSTDLGIESGVLASTINKLNRSVDPERFAELGIEIARTANGAVDVNQTFLNVIGRLNEISDPTKRATVATELLGKGWQSVSELISKGSSSVANSLAAVGEEKVFSRQQVEDSRAFRDGLEDLKDAAGQFATKLGKDVIPVAMGFVKALTFVAEQASDAADALLPSSGSNAFGEQDLAAAMARAEELGDAFFSLDFAVERNIKSFDDLRDELSWSKENAALLNAVVDEGKATLEASAEAAATLGDAVAQSARYSGLLADEQRRVADNSWKAKDALNNAQKALKDYQDQIKGRNDLVDLVVQLDDVKEKLDEIRQAHEDNKISDREYWLQSAQVTGDAQLAVSDYLDTLNSLPPTVKKKLLIEFDPNAPQKFLTDLQAAVDKYKIRVGVVPGFVTGPQDGPDTGPRKPRPGDSGSGTDPRAIGEGFGRSSSGVTVVVNAPVGANLSEAGRQVADALRAYYRNGGEPV